MVNLPLSGLMMYMRGDIPEYSGHGESITGRGAESMIEATFPGFLFSGPGPAEDPQMHVCQTGFGLESRYKEAVHQSKTVTVATLVQGDTMKAEINGCILAYGDRGNGLPLVLIHGFPLCRKMWRPQAEALDRAGCRVITPDLRGFGESGLSSGTVSMDDYADDIVALMDHLGIDKAVVGGMSMGGYVLLNLLERYPERVAASVFIVSPRRGATTMRARPGGRPWPRPAVPRGSCRWQRSSVSSSSPLRP
jgi:alpha/beta hydrolase fold